MTAPVKVYRRSELEAIKPAVDAEGCLFRFKAIWVDGIDDTSDVALVGIAFAAIQHRYVLSLVDNKIGQDYELAQAALAEGIAASQLPSRLIPEVSSLWKFHAESFELDVERFVASEEHGDDGGVSFAPDLVLAHPERNELEIVDDKSGWAAPVTEEQVRGLFQARTYSRYARDRWPGFQQYKFTLHAVRFKKRTSVVFTAEELDQVELEVQAAIRTIERAHETNQWPATPGPACHFCTLACPVASQEVSIPVRLAKSDVPKLASWLLVAEKQLKAAKKLMKESVATYGPVTVNGVEWDNRPVESVAYPVKDVMAVLELRGAAGAFDDPDLTLSRSALAKLFKKYPGLSDDLSGSEKTKTTYRFSAKKHGPDDEEE